MVFRITDTAHVETFGIELMRDDKSAPLYKAENDTCLVAISSYDVDNEVAIVPTSFHEREAIHRLKNAAVAWYRVPIEAIRFLLPECAPALLRAGALDPRALDYTFVLCLRVEGTVTLAANQNLNSLVTSLLGPNPGKADKEVLDRSTVWAFDRADPILNRPDELLAATREGGIPLRDLLEEVR